MAEICNNCGVAVVDDCVAAGLVVIICTGCTFHIHNRSPQAKIMSSENLNNNNNYHFLCTSIIFLSQECHYTN